MYQTASLKHASFHPISILLPPSMRGNRAHSSNRLALHKPICSNPSLVLFPLLYLQKRTHHWQDNKIHYSFINDPGSTTRIFQITWSQNTTIQLKTHAAEKMIYKWSGIMQNLAAEMRLYHSWKQEEGREKTDETTKEKKKSGERESKHICFQSGQRADPKYAFSGLPSSPELEEVDVHILP